MRVAVSVVLFHPLLARLEVPLTHLRAWGHGPVYVHVNDEGEGGPVANHVARRLPGAVVTSSPANLGFSGAHNLALQRAFSAGVEAAVVHNPDLVLDDVAVDALVAASQQLGGTALLGPALELADAVEYGGEGLVDTLGIVWTRSGRHLDAGQGLPWALSTAPPRPVAGVSGACLFVPRLAYERIVSGTGEFFDEDFIAYREDAELGFRAALIGVPSYLVPSAAGRHARGLRGTTRGSSVHVDRLGVRNRFLLAAKYGRHRPGGVVGPLARDVVVIAGVLARERSSLPGLRDAWRLRNKMRAKGRIVLKAARRSSKQAARL